MRIVLIAVGLCLGAAPNDPPPRRTLAMASIAVDGTLWARMFKEFGDEVQRGTHGQVRLKWYFGTTAGDELTALERVRKGELAGTVGASFCSRVAPSLRALEVPGLVQSDEEAGEVLRQLRPIWEAESERTPLLLLAVSSGLGHRVLFSRRPVRTLQELRKSAYWIYELDEVEREQLPVMGVNIVPLAIPQAGRAYDERRVDGFFSVPAAAVYYRYGVKAKYFTDLQSMFLPGCVIFSRQEFAQLGEQEQRVIREAANRLGERIAIAGSKQDQDLLTRIFPEQGLRPVPMDAAFQRDFVEAARVASARLGSRLIPLDLVRRVSTIVEAIRAGHRRSAARP